MAVKALSQPLVREQVQINKMTTLGASQVVPYGSAAANVGGVIKSVAAATAGQTLLGICYVPGGLTETTGADFALAEPARFATGLDVLMEIDSGDPPVQADIGKSVYFTDGATVHHTAAGNDVACILREIVSSTICKVRV